MSNYYWNEAIKMYGEDYELKDTLKLSERINEKLVTATNVYNKEMVENLQAERLVYSDVGIGFFDVNASRGLIFELFETLKDSYNSLDVITSIPIIFLPKEYEGYLPGVYSIDIYHQKLILIEDNIEIEESRERNIIVAFYLNIDTCVALEGIKGFVYGIEEIGIIVGKLREKFETKNVEIDMSRRAFSRSLGINIRKCSLIEVFAL